MPLIPLCPAAELKAMGAQADMSICILICLEMFVCAHRLLKLLCAHYFLRLENKEKIFFSVRLLLECKIPRAGHNSGACTLLSLNLLLLHSVSLRALLQIEVVTAAGYPLHWTIHPSPCGKHDP